MKPEDFGITKYNMLSSGKMEILQHVRMDHLKLEEFPFEVERLNGYLSFRGNKLKDTKSILFPIMGDKIELADNLITNADEFLRFNKDKINNISLFNNKIEEINIPQNFSDSHLNLFNNPLKKIFFTQQYWNGILYFPKLQTYETLPKYIKLMYIAKEENLDFKQIPQFSEFIAKYCSINNFVGSPISAKRYSFNNCKIDNFNYQFSPYNKNAFLYFKDSLIYKSNDYSKLSKHFEDLDKFKEYIKSSLILKNL